MPEPTIPAPQFPTSVTRAMSAYAAMTFAWNVYKLLTKRPPEVQVQDIPWRPKQWASESAPIYLQDSTGNVYVFDAILRLEHVSAMRLTEHPVQSGANIVDHSFQLPERIAFEVGMSDSMDSYYQDQWNQYDTKSISAFQKLKELQYARLPLIVTTRLNYYVNMVIETIHTPDDYRTANALRCMITMRQLITAEVSVKPRSKRSQVTNKTPKGTVQPAPLGSAISELGILP